MLNEMDLCIDVFFSQVETIEEKIELGNIEEVIELAKDELTLVDFYYGAVLIALVIVVVLVRYFGALGYR
jgi:hypothetical protein